ncbi:unnamed protein product [Meloidogyne enterolobii]|uniref:Uncharacterized protein n=1 Tax=Meloidogyne enterolobii TaxID=390850 RepID=A0ACB0Z6Z7_MELEN
MLLASLLTLALFIRTPNISASPCSTPGFVVAALGTSHSSRTSCDTRFGSPTIQCGRLAFEQDFCNTIKRQPNPSNSGISQQHQQQNSNFALSPFAENSFESTKIFSNRLEENDSDEADEEFFPLPPLPSSLPTSPIRVRKFFIVICFISGAANNDFKQISGF